MALAGIEYHGTEITRSCLDAIVRLYQSRTAFEKVYLLSSNKFHGFLLFLECNRVVAIKVGFSSGYPGEGPRGLATALRFFLKLNIPISEYKVNDSLLNRLNASALTKADLEKLDKSSPIPGSRWYDYIYEFDLDENNRNIEFREQFLYEVPIRIIDLRILDLALSLPKDPDAILMAGYRRLEEILKKRCGLEEGNGVKLFEKVFEGKNAILYWPDIIDSEIDGRIKLFIGTFKAFRNSRTHKEKTYSTDEFLREFLLLNELFCLESSAKLKKN